MFTGKPASISITKQIIYHFIKRGVATDLRANTQKHKNCLLELPKFVILLQNKSD